MDLSYLNKEVIDLKGTSYLDSPIYVVDTNVLLDYVDIIPAEDGTWHEPESPSVDLSAAHIVIPTVVIRELSNFKKEVGYRGRAARELLQRIDRIFMVEDEYSITMDDVYNANLNASVEFGEQTFTILPVHKHFVRALPFHPSDNDMDGQIILAALTIAFIRAGMPIDGTADPSAVMALDASKVILLTNDRGMRIRAKARGLTPKGYGYKYDEPYTGRRDLVVPADLFREFFSTGRLDREIWEVFMPDEQPLIANEFIIMSLKDPSDYPPEFDAYDDKFFRHIARYDVESDALVRLENVSKFPIPVCNDGQAIYAEALMNPDISAVLCTGPAGSGKTYMATVYGYEVCRARKFLGVATVPCRNRSNLGALPGDLNEKMDPDVKPIKNALRNYLLKSDPKIKRELEKIRRPSLTISSEDQNSESVFLLDHVDEKVEGIWKDYFRNIHVDNVGGLDFLCMLAIYDEFQDQSASQADALLKRLGGDSKVVITGDVRQIHAPYLDEDNNGLVYASRLLMDFPMVAQVTFHDTEVVRSSLVKGITGRQEARRNSSRKPSL